MPRTFLPPKLPGPGILISYDDANPNVDGEPRPTEIRITRTDDIYTFEFENVQQSTFCPASVGLAQRIQLKKGIGTCVGVAYF